MNCPSCGKYVPDTGVFCLHCGIRLRTTEVALSASSGRVERAEKGLSVSCAVPRCASPVIGQCSGFQQSCGRYYCANHSVAALCSDCADRKLKFEIYTDYLQIAEKVRRDTDQGFGLSRLLAGPIIGVLALVGGFGCLLALMESSSSFGPVLLIGGFLALYLYALSWASSQRMKRARAKAAEIDKSKPGFLQFYEAWDNKKPRDELVETLVAAGGFAAGLAGAAISSVARDEAEASKRAQLQHEVEQAVDDELKRKGL